MSPGSILLKSAKSPFTYPFSPVFFMLSTVRSFGIFPRHNGYGFISESFPLNLQIFTPFTYRKL